MGVFVGNHCHLHTYVCDRETRVGRRPVRTLAPTINRCLGNEQSSQDDSNFPNGGGDRLSKSVAGGEIFRKQPTTPCRINASHRRNSVVYTGSYWYQMKCWPSVRLHLCQPVDFDQSTCRAIKIGLGGVTSSTKIYFESKSKTIHLLFSPTRRWLIL